MELKEDARVIDAAGDNVGHIDRVVLNPKTKEVTAIVVRKGVLFTHDKIVPIAMLDASNSGGVILRGSAGNIDDLQDYESEYYVPADEEDYSGNRAANAIDNGRETTTSVYPYPPFGVPWPGTLAMGAGGANVAPANGEPEMLRRTQVNIADDEIALKKGTKVLSQKGDAIGNIDEVLTDPGSRRASHFVLSQGMLFKTRKLIPMDWVRNADSDRVQLVVGQSALDNLRDYDGTEPGPEVPIV